MRLRPLDTLLRWSLRFAKALDGRDDDLRHLDPAAIRCLLLVSSTALGDTVLSTAAFAPLRQRFPAARIVAVVHRSYATLFRNCAELDAVVPAQRGWANFASLALRLRRERPQLALILHGNEPQATPLAYLAGARWIVKLPNVGNAFRFLLSNREPPVRWSDLGHGLHQRLHTAALVGADIGAARMALPAVPAMPGLVEAFLERTGLAGRPILGFQCGASAGSRMWPAARFADLGRRLQHKWPELGIILTGSPDERNYLSGIARSIGDGVAIAAGELPAEALPTLIGRLQLLVSGDTGTMHVAVAVGTPTVCLFAVSDPATSGPAYDPERHIVIHHPCPDLGISTKSNDQRCIARISVDEVADAVQRQLAGNRGQ